MIEAFWALGVRMVGLTWARRNAFADGSGEPSPGGLSRLGQELVDRLLALGCAIDLAHASERTFADVLDRTDDGAALIVSHTCCRALRETPRNTSDDQLRAIAERNGVAGIMALASAVDPARGPSSSATSITSSTQCRSRAPSMSASAATSWRSSSARARS